MAKKPFEIQSADLIIGGINLQAGTTGVVIPGVTQATSYTVEEVEDNGDQTVTFQSPPIVIDYVTYLSFDNTGTSSSRAEYIVEELDDDGYIDEIEVTDQGAYTSQELYNEGNDLYAYTGSAGDPFASFVGTDWTQIPFRPKMRAGGVESIGGGGGLTIITPEDYEVQDVTTLAFTGAGVSVDRIDDVTTVTISGGSANTGNVVFDGNQLYVGGTGFLNLETDNGEAAIGTNSPDPLLISINEGDKEWTFGTDGWLSFPGTFPSGAIGYDSDTGTLQLARSLGVSLYTQAGAWVFDSDGDLTLPANGDILDSNGNSVLGGGSNSYTPEDTDHWNEPTVNTIQAALDELAARVTALQNYEIDGGNAYTPPQGELLIDGNGA